YKVVAATVIESCSLKSILSRSSISTIIAVSCSSLFPETEIYTSVRNKMRRMAVTQKIFFIKRKFQKINLRYWKLNFIKIDQILSLFIKKFFWRREEKKVIT